MGQRAFCQGATVGRCRIDAAQVFFALVWLRVVDGVKLSVFDWLGAGIALLGMGIIVAGWKTA